MGIDVSKVSVLDNGEMVKTEGEWWQFVVWGLTFLVSGYYAQTQTADMYNTHPR